MSGGGYGLAGGGDWAAVRRRYEDGLEPVAAIAAEAGVSPHALVSRARAEGWKLRRASRGKANEGTRATIGRLKALLQQRLCELEQQIGSLTEQASAATSERDIRATTIGMGGYIGGRSLEKAAGLVTGKGRGR